MTMIWRIDGRRPDRDDGAADWIEWDDTLGPVGTLIADLAIMCVRGEQAAVTPTGPWIDPDLANPEFVYAAAHRLLTDVAEQGDVPVIDASVPRGAIP